MLKKLSELNQGEVKQLFNNSESFKELVKQIFDMGQKMYIEDDILPNLEGVTYEYQYDVIFDMDITDREDAIDSIIKIEKDYGILNKPIDEIEKMSNEELENIFNKTINSFFNYEINENDSFDTIDLIDQNDRNDEYIVNTENNELYLKATPNEIISKYSD